jgi:hypothetical protein
MASNCDEWTDLNIKGADESYVAYANISGFVIDTNTLRVVTHKPLRAYEIKADSEFTGSANVYIIGPGYTLRTLVIDEQLVRDWLEANRDIIESMRVKWVNRTSPQVVVVLQEWISNTWLYVKWKQLEARVNLGKLGLYQESPERAARWNYLGIPGEIFSMAETVSNVTVGNASNWTDKQDRTPYIVAVDGITFKVKKDRGSCTTCVFRWTWPYKEKLWDEISNADREDVSEDAEIHDYVWTGIVENRWL